MPLRLLLRTYTLGAKELFRALRETARPEERDALTERYLDEQAVLAAERYEQRRSRARALLDGRPAA
ncbi:hypothetical protein [Streptomyces alanosinicus]|uniref:Uncharacterized protein n=1 Tax=Streptomyces alanosinicus TaxID=68171 RepID=A0A919D4D8_9ACTN|nr:hypothetical protein [Streptomyces alanosinicus]GHE07365.1 hypothetical protein GCM10010339_52170 [Streptomyces alanosinicus]